MEQLPSAEAIYGLREKDTLRFSVLNVGTCRDGRAPLPLQAPRLGLGLGLEEPRTLLQGTAGLPGPAGLAGAHPLQVAASTRGATACPGAPKGCGWHPKRVREERGRCAGPSRDSERHHSGSATAALIQPGVSARRSIPECAQTW